MKVLICCDHSPAGKYILEEAQKFLKVFPDVEINVFNVIDAAVVSVGAMSYNGQMLGSLEKESDEVRKWAESIFMDKRVNFSNEVGYPVVAVRNKATNLSVGLLILGTHGRTGFSHLRMGSVAESILRHTTCNTLVIPLKHFKSGEYSPN